MDKIWINRFDSFEEAQEFWEQQMNSLFIVPRDLYAVIFSYSSLERLKKIYAIMTFTSFYFSLFFNRPVFVEMFRGRILHLQKEDCYSAFREKKKQIQRECKAIDRYHKFWNLQNFRHLPVNAIGI